MGSYTFKDFDIKTSDFDDYKPEAQSIIIQEIIGYQREEKQAKFFDKYEDITHYLLVPLLEEQIISYQDNADLIYKLVTQTINHITAAVEELINFLIIKTIRVRKRVVIATLEIS